VMVFVPCSSLLLVVLLYALVTILFHGRDGISTGFVIRRLIDTSGPQRPKESVQINLSVQSGTLWRPDRRCSDTATEQPPCWPPTTTSDGNPLLLNANSQREVRAPWHPMWNNSIAICALMRQENITDVVEWLSYYKYAEFFDTAREKKKTSSCIARPLLKLSLACKDAACYAKHSAWCSKPTRGLPIFVVY
jgi:hypothetical protein